MTLATQGSLFLSIQGNVDNIQKRWHCLSRVYNYEINLWDVVYLLGLILVIRALYI